MNVYFPRIIQSWFLRFLQVQLFISIVSLPILISWGLPLSLLSPVGNLIFLPVLMAFLFLSSIIFLFELCGLPNGFIVYCLEMVTESWHWCMNSVGKQFLLGFTQPSVFFLIGITILAFFIIQNKKTNSLKLSLICLLSLLVFSGFYLRLISFPHQVNEKILCNNGYVSVVHENKKTVVIDPGVIGQRISAPSWVEYTLIPNLIKMTGSTTIDHLILMQPGNILFEAIAVLCKKMSVKHLYLVCWQGSLSKRGWRNYYALRDAAREQGTIITRISKKIQTIVISAQSSLTIAPLESVIAQKEIVYPVLQISGSGNMAVNLYSSKYKKKP